MKQMFCILLVQPLVCEITIITINTNYFSKVHFKEAQKPLDFEQHWLHVSLDKPANLIKLFCYFLIKNPSEEGSTVLTAI
jgi:hypothetical protein